MGKGVERGWVISISFQESAFETHASGRLCVWLCRRVQACARESAAPAPTGWPVRGRERPSFQRHAPSSPCVAACLAGAAQGSAMSGAGAPGGAAPAEDAAAAPPDTEDRLREECLAAGVHYIPPGGPGYEKETMERVAEATRATHRDRRRKALRQAVKRRNGSKQVCPVALCGTRALVVVVVAATTASLWLWILSARGYSSGCKWMCNQRAPTRRPRGAAPSLTLPPPPPVCRRLASRWAT